MASQSCDQERFERLRKKYKHVVVRGMVMPPFLTEEVYEGALAAMPLRDGDVFISTYPKSGTTWTQKIVHLLRYGAIPLGMKLVERVPWHETQPWGELNIDLLPSPRTYKSHLDWPMTFKVEEDVKYVYIARNGKDVAVSLFHHVRGWKGFECTEDWDGIFEMFMAGDIAFGRWFEHVLGWWRVKDRDDVLYLFYEDMKEVRAASISFLILSPLWGLSRTLSNSHELSRTARTLNFMNFFLNIPSCCLAGIPY